MTGSGLRGTSACGLAFVVLQVAALAALGSGGTPPSGADTAQDVAYVGAHARAFEAFAFLNGLAYVAFLVFAAGLRDSAVARDERVRSSASLFFGAALVLAAVAFVGGGLTATGAVDASERAEPASLRAMFEAGGVMFGPIIEFPAALMLAAAAVAVGRSGLSRWSARLGWFAAALNIAATPSIFGGSNPTEFYSAVGIAELAMALLPLLLWTLFGSISLFRLRPLPSA